MCACLKIAREFTQANRSYSIKKGRTLKGSPRIWDRPHLQSGFSVALKTVWVAFRARYTFTDPIGVHGFLCLLGSHSESWSSQSDSSHIALTVNGDSSGFTDAEKEGLLLSLGQDSKEHLTPYLVNSLQCLLCHKWIMQMTSKLVPWKNFLVSV